MKRLTRAALSAPTIFSVALPAAAQQRAPLPALQQRTAEATALSLEQAVALARTAQPSVGAYEREAQASEQAAVAARSLPDPEITGGIQNFPITGDNAFSPTADFMTMYTIGIMREQIRRSKREAEANRILGEALVSRKEASAQERDIRRDVMIAWVDAVEGRAKQKLFAQMIADLRTGRKVMEAGVPTGGSTPSLVLQAEAEIALDESQLEDAKRAEAHARAQLARWIRAPAYGPLPDVIPNVEVPAGAMPDINAHPEVQVALAKEELAQRQVSVAREGRKPDISWSVMLGIRPKFGEMISGSVTIPLRINRRSLQDRKIAAAQEQASAAALRTEHARRELESEHRAAMADYEGANAQLTRINKQAVPALESAFNAAEARYEAGGGGTLDQSFTIARRYLETAIQSVEAQARRARAAAQILHAYGETHQ